MNSAVTAAAAVPVIDLTPYRQAGAPARRGVTEAIAAACESTGFLIVQGHGVPAGAVEGLRHAAFEFFDLELERKLEVRRPRNDQNRGYIPYGEETLARMHGGETPPDFKEVFAIGPFNLPDEPYYTGGQAYPSFAPNLWPRGPAALRPALQTYFSHMEALMRLIAEAFAGALALPADYFQRALERHTSQLRLLHYPAPEQAFAPGQLRCGEHSDLGMMTILYNDATPGGLQVRTRNPASGETGHKYGDWVDVPAIENSFVVNLGDMMMRWTNDRWVSTPHRVAVPEQTEWSRSRRLSIGYFVGPNYDTVIECLPTCLDGDTPPRYAPVSVHDYRTERFAAGAGLKSPNSLSPS